MKINYRSICNESTAQTVHTRLQNYDTINYLCETTLTYGKLQYLYINYVYVHFCANGVPCTCCYSTSVVDILIKFCNVRSSYFLLRFIGFQTEVYTEDAHQLPNMCTKTVKQVHQKEIHIGGGELTPDIIAVGKNGVTYTMDKLQQITGGLKPVLLYINLNMLCFV